jgi:hypothetical protein
MSWTVACFCGTVFEAPPDRCPTCESQLPDAHSPGRIDNAPQRPGISTPPDVNAETMGIGALERELSELVASAPPPGDQRRYQPVDAGTPRAR